MGQGESYQNYEELEASILAFMSQDTPDELTFNSLALDIHRFQILHNQPLANFARQQGRAAPANWKEIPAVPTDAFKLDNFPLRAFPRDETGCVFHTSGTTGETPGRHHFKNLNLYRASVCASWKRFRTDAGITKLPKLVLTSAPSNAPHSSLTAMMEFLGGEFFISDANEIALPALRDRVETGSPVILMGTALALLRLSENTKLPLPPGSWLLETGGYKGSGITWTKQKLYETFSKGFDLSPARIINEYSMTELSSQFYATGQEGHHSGPPWIRARVLDPESGLEMDPGGEGYLEFCDLANLGSTIAIRTADLAKRTEDGSFQLIGRDPGAIPRGCSRSADEMLRPPPTSIFHGFDFTSDTDNDR